MKTESEEDEEVYVPQTAEARAAVETLQIRDENDAYAIITGCFDYIDKLVEFNVSDVAINPISRLAKVDATISPYYASHHAQRAITGAIDHLFTLRQVMKQAETQTTYGPFTILRGALESIAQGLYVLGRRNKEEMMKRVLRLEVSDDFNAKRFADRINSASRKEGRTDNIKARTAAAGLKWSDVKDHIGYQKLVETAGQAFGLEDNLTIFWMMTSGVAHNKPWAVVALTDRVEVEGTRDDVGATFTLTSNTSHIANTLRITCIAIDMLINTYVRQAQAEPDNQNLALMRSYNYLNSLIEGYRKHA